jgi:hypothetical protein
MKNFPEVRVKNERISRKNRLLRSRVQHHRATVLGNRNESPQFRDALPKLTATARAIGAGLQVNPQSGWRLRQSQKRQRDLQPLHDSEHPGEPASVQNTEAWSQAAFRCGHL